MTLFNSRNSIHRSPLGAVADGTRVHFKITLPRDMQCSASYLLVQHPDNRIECLDMFWCGMNGNDYEWWECHFTPQKTGLYFYHFELRTSRGRSVLKKDLGGEARAGAREDWQLTVYDGAYKTPDWLAGGILYQIFPDRFASSGKAKENVPADRTLHENWLDQPDWKPNAQGIVTNSDFFGGDLKGIEEKLDYLASLGVTCIYLNPIFESHSNHRYDTANYEKIDPLLGDEADFRTLCAEAKKRGIANSVATCTLMCETFTFCSTAFSATRAATAFILTARAATATAARTARSLPCITRGTAFGAGRTTTNVGGISSRCRMCARKIPRMTTISTAKTVSSGIGLRPVLPAGAWTLPTSCRTALLTA